MPGDGHSDESFGGGQSGSETLSCISCRNRKLKCDRTKPRCVRCEKANIECVFPESRRKPASKRRNAKDLEARLAQVEVLLKEASQNGSLHEKIAEKTVEHVDIQSAEVPVSENVIFEGFDFTAPDISLDDGAQFPFQQDSTTTFSNGNLGGQGQGNTSTPFNGTLIDLGGVYERLPPFEVMEDLNRIFFEGQQHLIPIVHPSRYLQAFYSAPHMKPPMCLQYAIWALAAHGHSKYNTCHDVFYRRSRQYIDADEMKGHGEHFITVAHAQAYCVMATYEAKSMMFTRAAMTCAKGVRLVEMMGLHRLDGSAEDMSPTLLPAKDWAELEERRRVFWGIFCIDSHCSISTGWPFLIDASEVTTMLPTTEYAFQRGEKEETCSLQNAFKGQPYSSFAGAVLVCHLHNQILNHVHKPKPDDHPDDYEYGECWKRHREIDNTLSSAFMYLPQVFRLPDNYRDPVAVHTNLNLHASVICLHHSAIERIDAYKLPDRAKKISQDRLTTAAQEIVNIVKLTSHVNSNTKSPLTALSIYCAASVYTYLCKENQAPTQLDNLDFLISAMEALGRSHSITRAFLLQVVVDIERNGIQHIARLPRLDRISDDFGTKISHNIPLLARSSISRHSEVQPPLPGRLPLGGPVGQIISDDHQGECGTWVTEMHQYDNALQGSSSVEPVEPGGKYKRRRVSPPRETSTVDGSSDNNASPWTMPRTSADLSTYSSPAKMAAPAHSMHCGGGYATSPHVEFNLPHRTGSPHVAAHPDATAPTNTSAPRDPNPIGASMRCLGPPPFRVAGRDPNEKDSVRAWDLARGYMHAALGSCGPVPADAGVPEPNYSAPQHHAGHGGGNIPWDLSGAAGINASTDWEMLSMAMGLDLPNPTNFLGGRGDDGKRSGAG
ncbi:hypothetical protein F4781DRAFT_434250 [Annulohypoxylon bovei var. microspora]|nr:hypothetical protein F4781DRAFT_434250 [Annulohypoxylon bovei var. microspora]